MPWINPNAEVAEAPAAVRKPRPKRVVEPEPVEEDEFIAPEPESDGAVDAYEKGQAIVEDDTKGGEDHPIMSQEEDKEVDVMEARYDLLFAMQMRDLRVIADGVGAPRRKKREDIVYEILAKEYPDDAASDPIATTVEYGVVEDAEEVKPERKAQPKPAEGQPVYTFKCKYMDNTTCPDCETELKGNDKVDAIGGDRFGMLATCGCDNEWRFILTVKTQKRKEGNGWVEHE